MIFIVVGGRDKSRSIRRRREDRPFISFKNFNNVR